MDTSARLGPQAVTPPIKIPTEHPRGPRGWTRWIYPQMKGYRLICCDCGLAHEVEFKAVQGSLWKTLPRTEYGVMFRMRRDARLTKRERKHKETP